MMSEKLFYLFHIYLTHSRHTFVEHFPQIACLQVQHIIIVLLWHFVLEQILRFFFGGSRSLLSISPVSLFGGDPQSSSAMRCMYTRRLIFDLHVSLYNTQLLIIARSITFLKTCTAHVRLVAFTEYFLVI